MPFREPRIRRLEGSVTYGPFPIGSGGVFAPFACLLLAVVLGAIGLDEDRLVCTPSATCVVTHRLKQDPPPFPASSLRDVSVQIEHGSKGTKHGVMYLVLDDESSLRFAKTKPEDADAAAARIREAIAAQGPIDMRVRGPWWALGLALVFAGAAIVIVRSTLRGMGRFRLDVVRDGSALRVQRSVLGIRLAPYDVSLEDVVDVRVEKEKVVNEHLREPPKPSARIVLVDRSGRRRPLTDRSFPGFATHLRAAAALRSILGLSPQPGGVEEQLAKLPLVTTPLGARINYGWLGLCVGGLLGLAVYGGIGLSLGLLRMSDGLDGKALGIGMGGGALAGVMLVAYLTRPRPPR